MTEKQYGGSTGRGQDKIIKGSKNNKVKPLTDKSSKFGKIITVNNSNLSPEEEKIIQAGKIASQVKDYAKKIVKPGMPLIEIAEKIEEKIIELGGKPAFPVNTSIDHIAAHYTPSHDDTNLARGLLKVDLGVHIEGWVADTALSLDLENNEENKKLIEVAEKALEKASTIIKKGSKLNEIGKVIEQEIEKNGFSPIINLSGHGIEQYNLHAGITIPNIDNHQEILLKKGLYAVEPFVTKGSGKVHDGKPSGIYELISDKMPRSPAAREVLEFIIVNYDRLPFCSRWVYKKMGSKGLFGLRQLEENGNLHHFAQLIEISKSKVAQAENTFLIKENGEVLITSK